MKGFFPTPYLGKHTTLHLNVPVWLHVCETETGIHLNVFVAILLAISPGLLSCQLRDLNSTVCFLSSTIFLCIALFASHANSALLRSFL